MSHATFPHEKSKQLLKRRDGFIYTLFRSLLLGPLLLTLSAASLCAQQETTLLPFFGYEVGVPLWIQREPGVINLDQFGTEGFGYSINHTFLFGLELTPSSLHIGNLSTAFRIALTSSNGNFISDPYSNRTGTIDSASVAGAFLPTENEFEVRAVESQIRLEGLVGWKLLKGIQGGFGPWIGYRISSSVAQVERILSPGNAIFATNRGKERIVAAGTAISSYQWRFGGMFLLQSDFTLGGALHLHPEIFTRFDNEALFNDGIGLRAFTVGASLGIGFNPPPRDVVPDIAAIPERTSSEGTLPDTGSPALPSFALSAAIDLYNADTGGIANREEVQIVTHRTTHTSFTPLVPTIQFASGVASIPNEYALLSKDRIEGFTEDRLIDQEIDAVQAQLLNIVGERLRRNPKRTIQLIGTRGKDEEKGIAAERTEQIRRYLMDVWGIDSKRITIAPPRNGNAGIVSMTSTDAEMLAPVVQRWATEKHSAPRIGLQKTIIAEAGVKRWEIFLRCRGQVLERYSSDQATSPAGIVELSFSGINDSTTESKLEAELIVEDYTDKQTTAHDQINLVRSTINTDAHHVRTWTFLDPTLDSSLAEINTIFLRSILSSTQNGSRLIVESTANRTSGEWSREQIAQKILTALQKEGSTTQEIIIREIEPSRSSGRMGGTGVRVRTEL